MLIGSTDLVGWLYTRAEYKPSSLSTGIEIDSDSCGKARNDICTEQWKRANAIYSLCMDANGVKQGAFAALGCQCLLTRLELPSQSKMRKLLHCEMNS